MRANRTHGVLLQMPFRWRGTISVYETSGLTAMQLNAAEVNIIRRNFAALAL